MIREWIREYNPKNTDETFAALREIMQEIALSGLSRTDFFDKAAFYGGTALRIFHGLDRFSEDLDFSLLEVAPDFSLEPYFEAITAEFKALGMTVRILEKEKKQRTNIESAFLKSDTLWQELVLEDILAQTGVHANRPVKIKIEVDRKPPLKFNTEEKLLTRPFSFYVKCFDLPSLFAGKVHAVLFRKWKNRIKGRDWYDLEWYIRRGIPLSINHFLSRATDTGDWQQSSITAEQVKALLQDKIKTISFERAKEDVIRFIKDDSVLDIWSAQYFLDLLERLRFQSTG